jgi:hypothetical protein
VIGVLAANRNIAQALIERLGLTGARPLSLRSVTRGGKGTSLDALLVHESALPVPELVWRTLIPALTARGTQNYVYELRLRREKHELQELRAANQADRDH